MTHESPAKFISFYKLLDAMKAPGCPICRRLVEENRRSIEGFLYESVNDPALRDEIRKDRGFCHRHSWQLARFGNALGSAILFRDVLNTSSQLLDDIRPGSFLRKSPPIRATSEVCLFCRLEHHFHTTLVSELVAHISDSELKAGWQGAAMLCVPHLQEVCAALRDTDARTQIIDLHRRKYVGLCEEMTRLIEKHSYDHRPEEIGSEKTSRLRAIEALVGMADVE
jgi:Family of unknown function (DUF6062)